MMTTDNPTLQPGANDHSHWFATVAVPPEFGHPYQRCVRCGLSVHLSDHDTATCQMCRSRAPVVAPQGDALALKKLGSRIGDVIEESLRSYRCQYTRELPDLEDGLLLIDLLTPEPDIDITRGLQELELLADYIAADVDDAIKEFVAAPSPSSPDGLYEAEDVYSDPREQVYCHACSAAGGAEQPVYHDAPACVFSPVPPEQDDGWVTFGRVKVDIENETETFERIHPPAATPTPVEQGPCSCICHGLIAHCQRCSGQPCRAIPHQLKEVVERVFPNSWGSLAIKELLDGLSPFIRAPSLAAREAAEEVANWLNWKKGVHPAAHEQNITSLTNMLAKYFCSSVPAAPNEGLSAMFTELYNCYTASKCAATDREEFLRLKGMAEAYQNAANRCREWPNQRRNDGSVVSPVPAAGGDEDGNSLEPLENELVQTAIAAHCRAEDPDAQDAFHAAASALIEARYQFVRRADSVGEEGK